jgi:hypothetical protein
MLMIPHIIQHNQHLLVAQHFRQADFAALLIRIFICVNP